MMGSFLEAACISASETGKTRTEAVMQQCAWSFVEREAMTVTLSAVGCSLIGRNNVSA